MVYLPHAFGIGTDASPRSIAFGNIRDYSVTGIPAADPRSPPTDPLMQLILFSPYSI